MRGLRPLGLILTVPAPGDGTAAPGVGMKTIPHGGVAFTGHFKSVGHALMDQTGPEKVNGDPGYSIDFIN